MRDFYEPSLLRRQLLWGLVGGLLAMTAVPLTVIWLNSLSVMPGDPLLVRASVLEATGWPWQVLLAVELALGFGFGVTVGLAVPPVLRLLEQSSDIPVLTGLLYPYVLLPFFCLVTGWSVGRRQGVALLYPVACGLMTVPHVFLLYHASALFQAWVAAGFALGGILAGALVRQGKEHAREKK